MAVFGDSILAIVTLMLAIGHIVATTAVALNTVIDVATDALRIRGEWQLGRPLWGVQYVRGVASS